MRMLRYTSGPILRYVIKRYVINIKVINKWYQSAKTLQRISMIVILELIFVSKNYCMQYDDLLYSYKY